MSDMRVKRLILAFEVTSALSAEMNYNVGKFKIFFLLNHFFLSLNIVNILQMNIDDEKSQMDLLKVQKHRK